MPLYSTGNGSPNSPIRPIAATSGYGKAPRR